MPNVRTKIVCTLGPSSNTETILRKMMLAGMDVARLNFSHGNHAEHLRRIHWVRQLNKKYRRHIWLLQDLEGFRIRIGTMEGFPDHRCEIKKHARVHLSNELSALGPNVIPFDYEGPLRDIHRGSLIFIEDGRIALEVLSVSKRLLTAKAVIPGVIKARKGINIPGIQLRFNGLTLKDRKDLAFGLEHHLDLVAQSFVRNANDALAVRHVLSRSPRKILLIAKIESRDGVKNFDEILEVVDGIMIARGDMGVCFPLPQVPFLQKMIIRKCRVKRKFVITATQMLESMTEHVRPTRAEVSDVANAIMDGTSHVMLSAETANGHYPVEAVSMMNAVCREAEAHLGLKTASG